uniref:Uncharacterized protein n=1 Tax=Candidatus Kentrum sp. MB TaxID=2138164 RepID=A0A450XUK8_9GAMM|nr:MAG: hypothetical protein BECKMB1821G_GA0114241_11326 [Candidatus Kentron sp. MB]
MGNRLKQSLDDSWSSFLTESLKKALSAEKEPIQWKFAILHLIHAVEISFKARLAEEHHAFIYVDPGRPRQTITIEQAIQRLQTVAGIQLSDDEIALIRCARDWRNQIIHSEFDLNEKEVKGIYAALLGFLSYFQSKHVEWSIENQVDDDLWNEAKLLLRHKEELEKHARNRIKNESLDTSLVWICRHCACKYFLPNESICAACGHSEYLIRCENCGILIYLNELIFLHAEYRDSIHSCAACASKFDAAEFGHFRSL